MVGGVGFVKDGNGEHGEALGELTSYIDDQAVNTARIRTQLGRFAFAGGTIHEVVYDVANDHYIDVENEFAARLASD
ncbi:hypothetical protein [Plantibacter sp. YIM 135249]|uniref:hypothetical protein n=1 Tax=Plantibacter sp. YIM 135249 TaxID=3423918 RepID=UPI003D3477A2